MPLHSTAKGEHPKRALAELVRRIERAGGTVVQIIDNGDEWLVQATRPPDSQSQWETRAT